MTEDQRLSHTMLELADTLVRDFDIVDFLHTLARRCADLFDVAEAGVMLADQRGGLRLVASSSERARHLELFELQNDEGPCLDAFHVGHRIVADDLAADPNRWPLFGAEAITAGFGSVYALALCYRENVIGALNLFRTAPGALGEDELLAAQALADIATIGILQHRAVAEARILVEQLQSTLNSRVILDQAKGVLAERAQISLDDAFDLLSKYARANKLHLGDAAEALISGRLSVERLLSSTPRTPLDR